MTTTNEPDLRPDGLPIMMTTGEVAELLHVDASTIKVFVHYLDGRRELSVIFSRKTRALTRESFFVTREFLASNPLLSV